jgi:RNA polymerase sigma factor (sigma-70 family)
VSSSEAAGPYERTLREQAARFDRLPTEEENRLLAARPDGRAVERLVEHNLDLVVREAEAHAGQGMTFADLYQEGSVGLVDAVVAFDGRGGFRDFASLHIGLQMDSLLESERLARAADLRAIDDARALDSVQTLLRKQLERDPDPAELARALGWEPARVSEVLQSLEIARAENDARTIAFLDDETLEELAVEDPEADPRRQLPGHGPDQFEVE